MTLKKHSGYSYGDDHADLREELLDYSRANGYPTQHFADALCTCGESIFRLRLDDDHGAAVRTCGADQFQLSVGVALYADSDDVRWLYVGGRCSTCGLVAIYGDWKNEFNGYGDLLARV